MPVSEQTYRSVLLEDPDGLWELHRGQLREKPGMSVEHNDLMAELGFQLRLQLDRAEYRVRINGGHLHGERSYFIPDVTVVPTALDLAQRGRPGSLEMYDQPLPLIVEVWSPSTGVYDVDDKLPEYRRRGDWEIWRLHPYERTLTAWRRQPDGTYEVTEYRGGVVPVGSLPGVTIDLDALFE